MKRESFSSLELVTDPPASDAHEEEREGFDEDGEEPVLCRITPFLGVGEDYQSRKSVNLMFFSVRLTPIALCNRARERL